jgi:opacity protein-like surface antigen
VIGVTATSPSEEQSAHDAGPDLITAGPTNRRGKVMTNRMTHLLAVAAIAGCLAGPAMADDAIPNVVGTWTGDFTLMHHGGAADQSLQFKILSQDGALLTGEKAWTIKSGTPGNVAGETKTEAVEPLVGVVDFDGTIYFAEQGDSGLYRARLTGPDTLQILYVEAGGLATAYRAELTRAK